MRLTKSIAEKNVGRYIDCSNRMGGYYPMQIIKVKDDVYLKDNVDVCIPIPEKETDFNCTNYDYIFELVK